MLSVAESAERLGVSPARVRALIKAGQLPAEKNGRAWVLREEDVLQRVVSRPRAGRPAAKATTEDSRPGTRAAGRRPAGESTSPEATAHELYEECRALFRRIPSSEMMAQAQSREEAAFYMAVTDFFLQQRQAQLVKAGIF